MPPRYLPRIIRAEEGATTGLPDEDSWNAYLESLTGDPELEAIMNQLGILQLVQELQGGGGAGAQEERLRAELYANSIPEGATYYPGLEPGGLLDSIMQGLGGGGVFAEEARHVQRAPLSMTPTSGRSGSTSADSDAIIQRALDYALGRNKPAAATASPTGEIAGPPKPTTTERPRASMSNVSPEVGNTDFWTSPRSNIVVNLLKALEQRRTPADFAPGLNPTPAR